MHPRHHSVREVNRAKTVFQDGYSIPIEDFVRVFNESSSTNYCSNDVVHISYNPMDTHVRLVFERKKG